MYIGKLATIAFFFFLGGGGGGAELIESNSCFMESHNLAMSFMYSYLTLYCCTLVPNWLGLFTG